MATLAIAVLMYTGCAGRGAMMTLQHNTKYEEFRSQTSSAPHLVVSDTVVVNSPDSTGTHILITTDEWGSRDWMKHQRDMRGSEPKAPKVMRAGSPPPWYSPAVSCPTSGGTTFRSGGSYQDSQGVWHVQGGGVYTIPGR